MPLAVTMGDAAGVGPELALRAWLEGSFPTDAVLIGDLSVLRACARALSLEVNLRACAGPADIAARALNVFDMRQLGAGDWAVGQIGREAGAAARAYVEHATRLAIGGEVSGIVTLPMNKEATRLSDPEFTGHTELIAGMCGVRDYTMMLATERLLVTHVTTHVSLRQAIELIQAPRVLMILRLTHAAANKLRPQARIAVAGLNPHAGENGAFGTEDVEQIAPAVAQARAEGIDATGPVPADTVFYQALKGRFDAVVCMYHDQGHVAMKSLDFEAGVNVTMGLPIVRTSVDHGTAFDIAWKGIASTRSFVAACAMAVRLAAP